jgi:hypothetical protein
VVFAADWYGMAPAAPPDMDAAVDAVGALVTFRVTFPEVPPPLMPVPAVTPVRIPAAPEIPVKLDPSP